MKNKVLVQLIVPDIEEQYDIFLPLNKKIGNIIILLAKSIRELSNTEQINTDMCLYNRDTGIKYNPESILINTDIRNGTILILI